MNCSDISILGLAYLGDGVYELLVRTYLAEHGLLGARNMHNRTVGIVNARAQSAAAEKILPLLTEDERDVFRRGRNAKVNSVPKNAGEKEYHEATALEAVFGWLWVNDNRERIKELFKLCISTESGE